MSYKTTLGGDRLGSGKKQDVYMHGWGKSNNNLSRAWRSTMAVGTLVPCYKEVLGAHDKIEIDIDSVVKTVPTNAPLYGSFKMQVDFFRIPMRLYTGTWKMNPLGAGHQTENVLFPKFKITKKVNNHQTNDTYNNSLLRYLGTKNIGCTKETSTLTQVSRLADAMSIMGYLDICFNYYINKQEKYAYMITPAGVTYDDNYWADDWAITYSKMLRGGENVTGQGITQVYFKNRKIAVQKGFYVTGKAAGNWQTTKLQIRVKGGIDLTKVTTAEVVANTYIYYQCQGKHHKATLQTILANNNAYLGASVAVADNDFTYAWNIWSKGEPVFVTDVRFWALHYDLNEECGIRPVELSEWNKIKAACADKNEVGEYFEFLPEKWNIAKFIQGNVSSEGGTFQTDSERTRADEYPMAGLMLKGYQSDIFNSWLSQENSKALQQSEARIVDVSNGSINLDALNMAKRVYNLLNRIAVTGGTIDDYFSAAFGREENSCCVIPVYEGGFSTQITFDEVVASAATATETDNTPLGALAGRGVQIAQANKGGHVTIEAGKEPCLVMAIASFTPYIDYSQGNWWAAYELNSVRDLHVPSLDGIGFQDLLEERMVGECAYYDEVDKVWKSDAVAKSPAWINYQTAVNEVFGEFADQDKRGFMVLQRDYSVYYNNGNHIGDFTTAIDPAKFNYAFNYTSRDSQNFWVQIGFKCVKRMVGSKKVIPNL